MSVSFKSNKKPLLSVSSLFITDGNQKPTEKSINIMFISGIGKQFLENLVEYFSYICQKKLALVKRLFNQTFFAIQCKKDIFYTLTLSLYPQSV